MTATVTATRSAELLRAALDPELAKNTFADPEKGAKWAEDYSAATAAERSEVLKAAQDAAMAAVLDNLQDQMNNPTARAEAAKQSRNYNPEAPGVAVEGIVNSQAEFIRAIYHDQANPEMLAKAQQFRNGMTTNDTTGYTVPESMRTDMLDRSLEASVVRPRATVVPMATSRVRFPVIDVTSHASTVFGGIQTAWTSEEGTITDSKPKFGEVVLDANKLTALAYVSSEVIQDSAISIGSYLGQLFPRAIAHSEDLKFIRGTGAGEPLGFLNAPALVSVSGETEQAGGTIVWENLLSMLARLLPGSYSNAVWVANPNTIKQLGTMGLSVGTGGAPVWGPDQQGGALPMNLLGRPLMFSEKMSTVGTAGDIALVDLSYYLIGDRQQMTAATSTDFKFNTDQVTYRFIQRLDGRPAILSALTPNQGSDTLSPFVTLATRS